MSAAISTPAHTHRGTASRAWGALVTALLFHLGRWGIAWYLGRSTQPSAFGAAASFAAMLLGAEFTACFGGVRDHAA